MVWAGRHTAEQKEVFCPCWEYTKLYFHLADWDRETMKFCRYGCAHTGYILNPVYRRDSLWRHGLCSSEQACCGFFPSSFKLWGAQNPVRHSDKEGLYGTQITWAEQTHLLLLKCTPLSIVLPPQCTLELELVTPMPQLQCSPVGTQTAGSTQTDTLTKSGNLGLIIFSPGLYASEMGLFWQAGQQGPGTELRKHFLPLCIPGQSQAGPAWPAETRSVSAYTWGSNWSSKSSTSVTCSKEKLLKTIRLS